MRAGGGRWSAVGPKIGRSIREKVGKQREGGGGSHQDLGGRRGEALMAAEGGLEKMIIGWTVPRFRFLEITTCSEYKTKVQTKARKFLLHESIFDNFMFVRDKINQINIRNCVSR